MALKDHTIGHKKSDPSRPVVFSDTFDYIEMCNLLSGISGMSWKVLLYMQKCGPKVLVLTSTPVNVSP